MPANLTDGTSRSSLACCSASRLSVSPPFARQPAADQHALGLHLRGDAELLEELGDVDAAGAA
jgi:hypothetical protein